MPCEKVLLVGVVSLAMDMLIFIKRVRIDMDYPHP